MHPSRQSRQTTRSYRTVLPLLLALVLALGAAVALLSGAPALA
ncbi:MAG: hypothetical protein R3272_16855 [Candidatus Promineifilaceae bacterium]|nr:hypothetical protein [Candidatus Promineifilaceae bacterium]